MKASDKMPPEKVLGKAYLLLDRLEKILDYQASNFDSESVESFDGGNQERFAIISQFLAAASVNCGMASEQIQRARRQLP